MRVYKRVRLVKGERREARSYTIDFRLPNGAPAAIPGLTDEGKTEAFGRKLDRLVACKTCHEALDRDLVEWIEHMPGETRDRLASFDLLDAARVAAGKDLLEQVDDFRAALIAKGATEKHANLTANRAKAVIRGCSLNVYSDITPSKVLEQLANLRGPHTANGKVCKDIGVQSSNFYLQAIKQFCRWMDRERRASESPISHLERLNVETDRRHDRRALETDECQRLLGAARQGKQAFCMTGAQREMLCRLAMESGLRWGELRSLTRKKLPFGC
jgi:integrase